MLLDKMYKYEMDPTRTVHPTVQTLDAGQTDGWTDGRSETNKPPQQLRCDGGIITQKNLICITHSPKQGPFLTVLNLVKRLGPINYT